MSINSSVLELLCTAYFAFFLLPGVHTSYPPHSVVTNVDNTGNTTWAYINSSDIYTGPPYQTSAWPPFTHIYPITSSDRPWNNVMAFTNDTTVRLNISTGYSGTMAVITKDPMILGVSSHFSSTTKFFYTLSLSGSTMVVVMISSNTTSGRFADVMIDIPFSNMVVAVNYNKVYTIDITTCTESAGVLMQEASVSAYFIGEFKAINAYMIGKNSTSAPIIDRSNFSPIKNSSYIGNCGFFAIDSINDLNIFMALTSKTLRHYNRVSWNVDQDVAHIDIDMTPYSSYNSILNLGPYQYIVTIPSYSPPSTVVFVDKTSFTVASANLTINIINNFYSPSGFIINYGTDRADFMVHDFVSRNFQSYYLLVDRCVDNNGTYVCQECLPGFYRMGISANNTCKTKEEFPVGYGIVVGATPALADLCSVSNCSQCSSYDNSNCTSCNSPFQLSNNSCITASLCLDSNCLNCSGSNDICIECDELNGYVLNQDICVTTDPIPPAEAASRTTVSFLPSSSKISIRFNEDIDIELSWQNGLRYYITDSSGKVVISKKTEFSFIPHKSGFDLEVLAKIHLKQAMIVIEKIFDTDTISSISQTSRRLQEDTTIPSEYFPVTLDGFTILNEEDQKKLSATTDASIGYASTQRSVTNIVLMGANVNIAVLMDRMLSDYQYFAMIGNQNLTYTRLLLDPAIQIKLTPFSKADQEDPEGNQGYIEKAFFLPECTVAPTLARNRVSCGIFSNYGSDIITLVGFLAVNAALTYLGLWLHKKNIIMDEDDMPELDKDATIRDKLKHNGRIIGYKVVVAFGMQFFIAKMDSNTLSIMKFCFTNIYYMQNVWQMWVGLLLTVMILVYYAFYIWIVWRFARNLAKKINAPTFRKKKIVKSDSKFRTDSINDIFKSSKIEFAAVAKMYSEYRADICTIEMYYPIALVMRSTLIAFWIVFLIRAEFATPILIAITEACYLAYTIYARVRSERLENMADVFNTVARLFYCVLACISLSSKTSIESIDIIMFITLLTITILNLVFATYVVMLLLYDIAVDKLCSQANHNERFKQAEESIEARFTHELSQFRKQILAKASTEPEKLNKLTIAVLKRDEQWMPIIEGEEITFNKELKDKMRLKRLASGVGSSEVNSGMLKTPELDHFNRRDENNFLQSSENQLLTMGPDDMRGVAEIELEKLQRLS